MNRHDAWAPILSTEHFVLTYCEADKILHLARTSARFASDKNHEPEIASVEAALRAYDTKRTGLLSDLREAPPRNDDSFEGSSASVRMRLFGGFVHSAVLVRTAVGKLQVNRLAVGHEATIPSVFQSEEIALTHLRDALRK